jgi:hypothetical protein
MPGPANRRALAGTKNGGARELTCKEVDDLGPRLCSGEMDGDSALKARFEHHLKRCTSCRDNYIVFDLGTEVVLRFKEEAFSPVQTAVAPIKP